MQVRTLQQIVILSEAKDLAVSRALAGQVYLRISIGEILRLRAQNDSIETSRLNAVGTDWYPLSGRYESTPTVAELNRRAPWA